MSDFGSAPGSDERVRAAARELCRSFVEDEGYAAPVGEHEWEPMARRALAAAEAVEPGWKAIAEDREREAALARRNEAASARRAEEAVAELDALPVAMRVAQLFVDTMDGQEACCACMERLTMGSPQQGHMEGCTYAALVELVEPR